MTFVAHFGPHVNPIKIDNFNFPISMELSVALLF